MYLIILPYLLTDRVFNIECLEDKLLYRDFLFELGVEEIPAGFIAETIKKMESFFMDFLKEEKLSFSQIITYSTPRRFAIKIINVQEKQNDEIIEKLGPAKRVAYDSEGNLSRAGQGFLRSAKASEKNIFFKNTEKGEYLAVKIEKKGEYAKRLLEKAILNFINNLAFPKSMRWHNYKINFARPIRWILAIFDSEILEVKLNKLVASNISYGNRFQKIPNNITVENPKNYEVNLEKVFVIPNRTKRKEMIKNQMDGLFKNSDDNYIEDKKLLEIVTDLVEYPTAIIASFDKKYLKLPQKIITSTLTQHQKYFAVSDKKNNLKNNFVFISNGNPEFSEIIKLGNEKVITARLEDAEFFFDEDTKEPFENFVPKLDDVLFQSDLGTLLEKTVRVGKICGFLCSELNFLRKDKVERAAYLCKADLVSQMLGEKEFTKLQGYIGMNYARFSNEDKDVSMAIYEHYMPRGERDSLPSNEISAILAIADKLDTVCGIIGVGLLPSGSKDPFALRRAANGIVQIIDAFNFNLNLKRIVNFAFKVLSDKIKSDSEKEKVYLFFNQRVLWLLKQKNIDSDIIKSITHIDASEIVDLKRRAEDIQKFKKRDDFNQLVLGFKRVSNIIGKNPQTGNPEEKLLENDAEKNLYKKYVLSKNKIESELKQKKYSAVMNILVEFRPVIDDFFDNVLVNTDKEYLKFNRYKLLGRIRDLFLMVSDLAKINE